MAPADSETILDKVLEIAGDKGWTGLTMEMVAEGAGVPLDPGLPPQIHHTERPGGPV